MTNDERGAAKGRMPPPVDAKFRKGRSGNPKGRPKGSVSLDGLTRKFALKKQVVKIDGKQEKLSRLEIVVLKLTALAASGQPAAARLMDELRHAIAPNKHRSGVLIVPADTTIEAHIAEEEERNRYRAEPGTEVNIEHEEYMKALQGEPSPLGEALLAFRRKWHGT